MNLTTTGALSQGRMSGGSEVGEARAMPAAGAPIEIGCVVRYFAERQDSLIGR